METIYAYTGKRWSYIHNLFRYFLLIKTWTAEQEDRVDL